MKAMNIMEKKEGSEEEGDEEMTDKEGLVRIPKTEVRLGQGQETTLAKGSHGNMVGADGEGSRRTEALGAVHMLGVVVGGVAAIDPKPAVEGGNREGSCEAIAEGCDVILKGNVALRGKIGVVVNESRVEDEATLSRHKERTVTPSP